MPSQIRLGALCAACALTITGLVAAQSPAPTPDAPPQTSATADAPLNPALPTVFIVGDSTARNGVDLGWGDHFAHLLETSRIQVANRAIAGRSSRSYIAEGHWASLLTQLKAGDFVLIQMGHNDGAGTPESVLHDPKNRTSLKGLGNETVDVPITDGMARVYAKGPFADQAVETVHTYGWYMRKMIDEAKAKGAIPMVLTTTVRNIWAACPKSTTGQMCIERDMGFRNYDIQIADQEKVYLIDMGRLSANAFESMGEKETAAFFPIDHTHTSALGAEINAASVARALGVARSPLAEYIMGHD